MSRTIFLKSSLSKKATLEMNLDPQLPVIDGDPSQLWQVAMNLLLNAIEASRKDDVIEISTRVAGAYYVLQVRDHGVGLDFAKKQKIFDLMYTTKPYGFGIGLTV